MKFKKIIPALALLLMSAILATTASYAWFAMNVEVTANGMLVEAQSNSKVLQITNESNSYTGTAEEATAKLSQHADGMLPCNYGIVTTAYKLTLEAAPARRYDSTADASETYYEIVGSNLIKVTPELTSSVAGYYSGESLNITKMTGGVYASGTYYEYVNGTYSPKALVTDDPLSGYYTIDTGAAAMTAGSLYDGKNYLEKTGESYKYLPDLHYATLLTELKKVTGETVTATADGTSEYYFKDINNNYISIGTPAASADLSDYLYWGYAYSNDPDAVQENNAITVTYDDEIYLKNNFYVRILDQSNKGENFRVDNIVVEANSLSGTSDDIIKSISILFVAKKSDGTVLNRALYKERTGAISYLGTPNDCFMDEIASTDGEITIESYIFFDGTDNYVKTSSITASTFQSFKVKFSLLID